MKYRKEAFRELRTLTRATYQAERRRTILTIIPLAPFTAAVIVIGSRAALNAVEEGATGRAMACALLTGVGIGLSFVVIFWQIGTGIQRLAAVTGIELDRQVMGAVTSARSLAIFDDPEMLDRMELLRVNKRQLSEPVSVLRDLVWVSGSVILGSTILCLVAPALAVLGVISVGVGWVYWRSETWVEAAELTAAGSRREALHLFDVGTSPAASKEIRVFDEGAAIEERFQSAWHAVDQSLSGAQAKAALARIGAFGLFAACAGALLYASESSITGIGDILLLVLGVIGLSDSAVMFGDSLSQAVRTMHLARHLALLRPADHDGAGTEPVPTRLVEGIELADVGFRYRESETPALSNIDVRLEPGTVIAVVGSNGAGKSTLVNLLCGLYEPTSGAIVIDGVRQDDLDPRAWRSGVTIVAQDFARFELFARENVGLGDHPRIADDEAVRAALARSDAEAIVDRLPDGLEAQLGSRFGGVDLSGGEWQRLAVSRGLMRTEPLLVVMDEPTASLDPLAEVALLASCVRESRELAKSSGAIVVFVSHRYSTVKLADRILVMSDGRIVEDGPHDRLVALGGVYAAAYTRQADDYSN